jgi:molybdopterin converting factor small subunit
MIQVLFFGPVADRVKTRELQLAFVADMKLQDVVTELKARYPKAFDIVCFTAVNQTQVSDMQLALSDGDEIAFMAKFSGG